jgi:hypothetical protein
MLVLLNECVPRRLRAQLTGHTVRTVPEMGWSGKKNGELLNLMAGAGLEVLVTVDQGIRHQQNLRAVRYCGRRSQGTFRPIGGPRAAHADGVGRPPDDSPG